MITQQSLPLMIWLSPAFPVGAFAYSHGLEWAVENGDIHDLSSACVWMEDLMQHGSGRSDSVAVSLAYRLVKENNAAGLQELCELVAAMQPGAERRLETLMQGQAFETAIKSSWSNESFVALSQCGISDLPYPVVFGLTCACHDVPLTEALRAFGLAFISNLVSALIRLGPLGQTAGQQVLARLLPLIENIAAAVEHADWDELGGSAFYSDLSSMRHETQYTRLFRS